MVFVHDGELEWKGLKSESIHVNFQEIRCEAEATYLDTSAVVGHPRGQRNQHCNEGQKGYYTGSGIGF